MELSSLATLLSGLNIPIAYNHFVTMQKPPFIIYKTTSVTCFSADNKVYEKIKHIDIELYTENKNETLEGQLETILCNNEMVFESFENYIESENMYQVIYEITV